MSQKRVAAGDTCGALGHPRPAMFLDIIAFFKGPASMKALCGMCRGVLILCLGGKKGKGVGLSCSGLGLGK